MSESPIETSKTYKKNSYIKITKDFTIAFTSSSKFPFSFAFYIIFIVDNGICGTERKKKKKMEKVIFIDLCKEGAKFCHFLIL